MTLDDQVIRADAVGITDGKIIFVGSNQDAEAYIGEDTVVTDCRGKSVFRASKALPAEAYIA